MDYSLIHRTPDGNGKILVTTPGSPDKGSWETEAELKTYVNQDVVKQTDIVQSLGQQVDKVPSNKAVDDAINAIISDNFKILDGTLSNEIGVSTKHYYPSGWDYNDTLFVSIMIFANGNWNLVGGSREGAVGAGALCDSTGIYPFNFTPDYFGCSYRLLIMKKWY